MDQSNRRGPVPGLLPSTSGGQEAGLLLLIAAGDRRAFEHFYRLYFPRLTRFLDKMMRRPALVEEVLDDTMLVVWQKAATYNGQCRVSTWVFSIAYRRALKALEREGRHLGREPESSGETTAGPDEDPGAHAQQGSAPDGNWDQLDGYRRRSDPADEAAAPDDEPEARLAALQSRRMIEHLLAKLSPEQRAVVELTYYYDCSYKEIAAIAGCPVDTVKTRMFHARRKLRLLMASRAEAGGL